MWDSSIQVTVDIYGHLIPGANVSFVDKLDELAPKTERKQLCSNPNKGAPANK
jgi:hypothetical protein